MNYFKILLIVKIKAFFDALPILKNKRYAPFLIVGHARTGTSLLHTYLNSHLNVLSINEPLSSKNNHQNLFSPKSILIKVFGFKYFYEYIFDVEKRELLNTFLRDNNIKIIKIHRKNMLRTLVSLKIAERTKEWSSVGDSKLQTENKQLTLTKQECLLAFENYKNAAYLTDEVIKQYKTPCIEIDYDTLVDLPEETMAKVQQFLGVSVSKPLTLLARQNPEDIKSLLLNFDELKQDFEHTEYQPYFI
jgi:LPS sulfotransferase NodH